MRQLSNKEREECLACVREIRKRLRNGYYHSDAFDELHTLRTYKERYTTNLNPLMTETEIEHLRRDLE